MRNKIAESLGRKTIPLIKLVSLTHVKSGSKKVINNLLEISTPELQPRFNFNLFSPFVEASPYFNALLTATSKITKWIWIYRTILTNNEFSGLLTSSINCIEIGEY